MDRDWMSEPRTSASYKDGVAHFLSIAFRDVPDDAKVLCPCVNCRNRITQNYDRVKTHLRCAGILQSYTKWIHHGEKYDAPSLVFAPVSGNPRNIPISGAHKSNVVEVGDGRSDNMEGLLNTAFGREDSFESISSASIDDDGIYFESSYAEPNMVEDENNTFGDCHNGGEQDMFTRLLKDAKTKLYHGCDKFSRAEYLYLVRRCVNMKDCTLNGLKSHDCHVLLEDILPIALRSCYPSKDVMHIVNELARFFKKLCSKVIDVSELDELQRSIVMTLCDMERVFLPSFFTIMVHLLVHLVEEVKLGGPVHYRWMYPLERSFVRIKALVRNRAYPEGSIVEGYIADECLTYCSRFFDETTRFTRPPRNPEPSDNTKDLYMFESAGEPIGKAITVARFDNQFLVQAHRYVLRHCDELEDFRKEFLDEEKRKLPHTTSLTQSVIDRLSDIVELSYRNYKVVLFRCDWYDVHHRAGMKNDEFRFSLVNFSRKIHTGEKLDDDPFVFSSQVEQVFYSEDPKTEGWHVVTRFRPRDLFDMGVEQPSDEAEQIMVCQMQGINANRSKMSTLPDDFCQSPDILNSDRIDKIQAAAFLNLIRFGTQDGGSELEEENSESDDDAIAELPSAIKRPINIIFPNGEVRQILGNFNVKNMEQLKNGKVIVETDENGVPNDRSGSLLGSYLGKMAQNSTFAPLHIPKWDDDLFVEPQKCIVAHVETKFVYPSETKLLTRDWVLMKVSKGWRSYKHRLKDRYYNLDVRTLNEIPEDVPKGVNAIQWVGLLAIWGQDKHKKLCEKNSECAKQQRNPHTTGRKSHAMLFKEMGEAKKRGKVHEIDLWDEAHKKKDAHMKAVLDMAYHELAKRKTDSSGVLSPKDYDDVFRSVVGKKTKLRGYYDHKNWSHLKVSQGLDVIGQSEEQAMLKLKIKAMDDKLEDMSDDMNLMRTFIEQKYPGENWRNIVVARKNKEVDISEQVGNDIPHEFENILDKSYENVHPTPNNLQELHSISYTKAKDGRGKPSLPHEHMITKQSGIISSAKVSESSQMYIESTRAHDNGNKKQVCSLKCTNAKDRRANPSIPYERTNAKGYSFGQDSRNDITNGSVNNFEDSHTNRNAIQNNVQRLQSVSSTRPKESYSSQDLPYQNLTTKQSIIQSSVKRPRTSQSFVESILPHDKTKQVPQRKEAVLKHTSSKSGQREVYLFSLNAINKDKLVAKGNLVTANATHVVGRNMLGNEYYGVAIHTVTNIGDERLPRPPFENCNTLRDAIGYVIAWPRAYDINGGL
ncbi:Os05g0342600 [Oryza sativa Japonica Group]|uniref:Os05g0342600 protein n=1 Tax=Oryza sativa subsp. japonica TaxID=39947 RepID=Q0DJ09_ORYSJ|nr:Os05g0342600 [Oryza sativa Japonica Group]|eukprot:NP_001055250.2 Os05g0342600 [Oryza sativa Japonica Group]